MRKLHIILVILICLTVFMFTWQYIPYVNTWIYTSGIDTSFNMGLDGVKDAVRSNPLGLLGALGTALVGVFGAIRKGLSDVQKTKDSASVVITDLQAEFGTVKNQLTGKLDTVTTQFTELQTKYTTDTTKLQDEKDQVTKQLLTLQTNFNKQSQELKESLIEVGSLRNALNELKEPNLN